MKTFLKLFLIVLGLGIILSSCSSTKTPSSSQHDRGVNNRHFQGY